MAEQEQNTASTPTRTDRKNISSIETFFDGLLRGSNKLTEHLFFGELPTSIDKNWSDVVIVNCMNPMDDYDAFGRETVLVQLYAKPNAYGQKDVYVMQNLEKKLNALIEASSDAHYHVSLRGKYSSYDAVNDIYGTIVQINLIIT